MDGRWVWVKWEGDGDGDSDGQRGDQNCLVDCRSFFMHELLR